MNKRVIYIDIDGTICSQTNGDYTKAKPFSNAIKKVNTEYCTFLYDDDLLSEEVIKVFKQTMNNKFSIGYGIVENLNNYQNVKHNFSKIKFAKFNNEEVLLAYFGENKLGVPPRAKTPLSGVAVIF